MPTTEVNGIKLGYDLSGSGPVDVAFLNGIAMSISHWKPVMDAMGGGYRFIRHDMRGQTLSDKPVQEYSLLGHAEDLVSLLDRLSIPSAVLVGTSYGAEVAVEFALAYPERCEALVLIDGVSELDPLLKATIESWMASAALDPRVFYRTILPWNYSGTYIKDRGEELAAREDAVASLPKEWFEAFVRLCASFLQIDQTGRLGKISCPCLVVVAQADILKGERFATLLAQGIPGATLERIPEAGHAVAIERPDLIARLVTRFLQGVEK